MDLIVEFAKEKIKCEILALFLVKVFWGSLRLQNAIQFLGLMYINGFLHRFKSTSILQFMCESIPMLKVLSYIGLK